MTQYIFCHFICIQSMEQFRKYNFALLYKFLSGNFIKFYVLFVNDFQELIFLFFIQRLIHFPDKISLPRLSIRLHYEIYLNKNGFILLFSNIWICNAFFYFHSTLLICILLSVLLKTSILDSLMIIVQTIQHCLK